ncbi:MAG: hypothetical protein KC729_15280 [Candidatus Eisenbacteria bacterium]|uniref:Uncharacterized protein n=1 Tax=Eiseniibacteriota bacterium TaxID=2212470 RepID=A0A956M2M9_UNCEI|nr:hypothetical protein [Candidatus Eisenbacteria bacterium]
MKHRRATLACSKTISAPGRATSRLVARVGSLLFGIVLTAVLGSPSWSTGSGSDSETGSPHPPTPATTATDGPAAPAPPSDEGPGAHGALIELHVKYVSIDRVFLDGGRGAGFAVGDTLTVWRDGNEVAHLVVESVATSSSSCMILGQEESTTANPIVSVEVGDLARGIPSRKTNRARVAHAAESGTNRSDRLTRESNLSPASRWSETRLRGGVSLVWQNVSDDLGNTTNRPTARVRLHASRIHGSPLYVRVRASLRRIDRAPTSSLPDEWNDRVTAAFLGWENDRVDLQAGRIPYVAAGGIGHLDGALAALRIVPWLEIGAFGGTLPGRQYIAGSTSVSNSRKFGFFVTNTSTMAEGLTSEQTLAASDWYDDHAAYRRYLASTGFVRWERGLTVSHTLELDRNLQTISANPWTLTTARLSARYALNARTSVSVQHENRSTRTYLDPNQPDSTSVSSGYRGTRASLSWTPRRGLSTRLSGGIRKTEADSLQSYSVTIGATTSRIPDTRTRVRADVQLYRTRYAEGWNPSIALERSFFSFLTVGGGTGARSYTAVSTGDEHRMRWSRWTAGVDTRSRVHLRMEYETTWGDDPGRRSVLVDLGYSF